MKALVFILGFLTGTAATYGFLTHVWWPDVRLPERNVIQASAEPTPVPPLPSGTLIPEATPEGTPDQPQPLPSPPFAQEAPSLAGATPSPAPSPMISMTPNPAEPPMLRTDTDTLRARGLVVPVVGIEGKSLHDDFTDDRGGRHHEAIDILAPRGTPVIAVDDGKVEKLFTSKLGGLTIYQFDPQGTYCYYYAHLDSYAPGIVQGKTLRKGDVIGFVGTTGNAPPNAPHLHFTIFRLGNEKRWWEGTAINAYPLWGAAPPR